MILKAGLLSLGLAALSVTPIQAHDIYKDLKDKKGVSCCGGGDCRPAHYRIHDSRVQMRVDNGWLDIPPDVLDYRAIDGDTGETKGGHWCGRLHRGNGWTRVATYCAFLPPNLTSR